MSDENNAPNEGGGEALPAASETPAKLPKNDAEAAALEAKQESTKPGDDAETKKADESAERKKNRTREYIAKLNRENAELRAFKAEQEAKKKAEAGDTDDPVVVAPDSGGGAISTGLAGIGGSPDKADKIKNINVTIEKVIDKFEIHTTNMHEDIGKVKEMVAEALTGAVNDVNYAM